MAEENQIRRGPGTPAQGGVTREKDSDEETRSRIQQSKEQTISGSRVAGGEVLDQAKQRLRTFKEDTDTYVRNNPTKAVLTALGIGFVLGLMRRR